MIDLAAARAVIAERSECAGPITTLNPLGNPKRASVGIICDADKWDTVVRWLATCEREFPAALSEIETLRAALAIVTTALDEWDWNGLVLDARKIEDCDPSPFEDMAKLRAQLRTLLHPTEVSR